MATIYTLTKVGKEMKFKVKETVRQIWEQINGRYDINNEADLGCNRDFLILTDIKGQSVIYNRKYPMRIEEN